jgi:hypothetical protein
MDAFEQRGILSRPLASWAVVPGVEAASEDLEHAAELAYREGLPLLLIGWVGLPPEGDASLLVHIIHPPESNRRPVITNSLQDPTESTQEQPTPPTDEDSE